MPKKDKDKPKQGRTDKTGEPLDVGDILAAQQSMERDLSAIEKLVSKHEFKSEEELDKFIQDAISSGELYYQPALTPLDEAQELVYQAWETPNTKERVKLARKALEISPDCADAYVLLAEESAINIQESLRLYQAGVEAGERALGLETFTNGVGCFWGMVATRPYMRARAGLAQCLWAVGRCEESIKHYRDMLRLNPGDNQGIRYFLAAALLEIGEVESLRELLGQYDECSAAWLYTEALVIFLQQGDSHESRQCLLEAIKCNRYVVPYLLHEKKLPKELPEYMGFGDKNEAVIYAAEFGLGWFKAKGAIAWLSNVYSSRQTIQKSRSKLVEIPEVFLQAFESEGKAHQPVKEGLLEIYTFKVSLKESPRIWRKIEIKGNQTLHQLHKAIFRAFDRFDEHLYAFFLSNKPWDSSSEYGIPDPESDAKNAKKVRINSLSLRINSKFLYLFDFGDEWWHSIRLVSIKEDKPKGTYPRVVEAQGTSPPQYPPYEEHEWHCAV